MQLYIKAFGLIFFLATSIHADTPGEVKSRAQEYAHIAGVEAKKLEPFVKLLKELADRLKKEDTKVFFVA